MKLTESLDLLQRVRDGMQRRMVQAMSQRRLDEVLPSYGDVLCLLKERGKAVPVSELVVALRRPKSTITKATDFLAREGLLTKRPNPVDGRSILVELTEKGGDFAVSFEETREAVRHLMFQGVSAGEEKQFFAVLEKVENNLYSRRRHGK